MPTPECRSSPEVIAGGFACTRFANANSATPREQMLRTNHRFARSLEHVLGGLYTHFTHTQASRTCSAWPLENIRSRVILRASDKDARTDLSLQSNYKRFLRRYSVKPAPVSFPNSRNNAGSGPVKLKQDNPCMRFLSSGDTFLRNDSSQYSGMRWKLTYALPEITAPKNNGFPRS